MTLVEPGPVVTEFERKVYEEVQDMDLSGTDEETARIFREIYLPNSRNIFSSLGQTAEEVAEVSTCTRTESFNNKEKNDNKNKNNNNNIGLGD